MLRVAGRRLSSTLAWRPAAAGAGAPLAGGLPRDDEDNRRPLESPFFTAARGFSAETLVPRNQDAGLAELPRTVAAVKNPSAKIVYDEYNHERYLPGDPSKRAFAYFVLSGGRFIYASLLRLLILKFVLSMSASKDVLALASLEVDLSSIEPGTTVTVKWRGKPVFIRRRTEDDIKLANSVDVAALRHPEQDAERVKNPEWLVVIGVCTHLGRGITEVERAMAKRKGSPLIADMNDVNKCFQPEGKTAVKGFNFTDDRVMNGNWINEPHSDVIQMFFRLLAVCHTCIPEVDEQSGKISYEAESPDEAAFVVAAGELGFKFYQRTQTSISLHELDPLSRKQVDRSYRILHVLEFNSARKRMSVIVKDEEGKTFLFSKGADSVMFERLSSSEGAYRQVTQQHINEYADAGLRTLVLAYRELEENEYAYFDRKFTAAKNSVSTDRDEKIEEAADLLERDLILLGATAVEDKLQKGVPECIDKLAQAGIKIWVLTGDKMETAINIGYACSLLRQGMKQITITLETADIIALEKGSDKAATAKASKDSVVQQINEGKKLINASSDETFALIIDGKSLTYALEDDAKAMFLDLAIGCGSVICCRSSPKQKALVTRLVKTGTGKITLAIGDGANDVGMIQEADIGVGISGAEGMQAVMASDVSIAQFRFLERLLLVHGHWCYSRISSMICYFFYKNITFGVTLFLYEAYTSFSGQAFYNDWAMALYNVLFTSLPVIAMGVFDQDVSARFCLKYPMLYQEGPQNLLFRWSRILGWMLYGVVSAVIIFFLSTSALQHQAFRKSGEVMDIAALGATAYTCVVWAVNAQMAITVSYFTLIQHICIWGGIALWYVFLVAYGAITPTFSTTYFMVFVDTLAGAASYWVVTLLVSAAALIPYFTYAVIKTWFFPDYHNRIQWLRHRNRGQPDSNADVEFGQALRQFSVRSTGVGVSARRDATELVRLNQ